MKKVIFFLAVGVLAAVVTFGIFAWRNLRGIGPALRKSSAPIESVIGRKEGKPGLRLPPAFDVSLFAKGLGKPRVLAIDPQGTLLVSIPSEGRVIALPDRNRDRVADEIVTVIADLKRPHGIAFGCNPRCNLYIAEENEVGAYSYDPDRLKAVKLKKICDLPSGGFHVTRSLLFLPGPRGGTLLVSVGSSCNVCAERDSRRAAVLSVPAEGGTPEVFASGLRNAVFLAIHPGTGAVWATEMGRDMLGDDLPPDEIDIVREGGNYGWPYCYGKNVHDDEFDPGRTHACREPGTLPSVIDIPAHSAPLGLAFFPREGWPPEYANDLLVAYHGSWNRSVPTGYKIVRYHLDESGKYLGKEDFVSGWLVEKKEAFGRPVDILIRNDGTFFVSDDKAGVIYLFSRRGTEAPL